MADQPRTLTTEALYQIEGSSAPKGRFDAATIRFTGNTGLVGTAFGIPNISATRVGTGHYRVHMPYAPNLSQKFSLSTVSTPTAVNGSGIHFGIGAELFNKCPASGTVEILFGRSANTGTGVTQLTDKILTNPPTLTEVDLFVFTTPITQY